MKDATEILMYYKKKKNYIYIYTIFERRKRAGRGNDYTLYIHTFICKISLKRGFKFQLLPMTTEAVSLWPDSLHGSLVIEVVILQLGQHYLRGKLNLGITFL